MEVRASCLPCQRASQTWDIVFRGGRRAKARTAIDAPDAQESCTRRERSTTALQALNLLNDPVFFEAAQALAIRLLQEESGDVQKRLEYGFQVCLAREPNSTETDRLLRYYEQQREILRQEPASIAKVLPLELIDKTDPASAAAWVGVSSVLLNLEEFITRE